jgi:DNA-directed RNA polymerase subunit E'/Rpb7
MQHTTIFEEQVTLDPRDQKRKVTSIESILLNKLQAKLEGRCSRHGYVIPGSVKILSRSMGTLEKGRFTGGILFFVQAEGEVLNPPDGIVVEGEVIRKNKMGMYVSYENAIRIIVPRDLHIGQKDFEDVEIGERVQVEIKKARFQVNDPYILAVGVFLKAIGKGAPAAAAAAVGVNAVVPEEELDEEGAEDGDEAEGEEAEGEEAEEDEGDEGEEAEEAEEDEGDEGEEAEDEEEIKADDGIDAAF